MQLIDYTHPGVVPALRIPLDRRSAHYYARLNELPPSHPYHSPHWAVFRYPEWLAGGSAWLQAALIDVDLQKVVAEHGLLGDVRPVVGSADPAFDEAIAQALLVMGWRPKIAEVISITRS